MSNEHLHDVRAFHKNQVNATAQAALTATDHIAKHAELHVQAGKELITVLQSHSERVLDIKDLAALAEANRSLVNTLVANSTRVTQDLLALNNQFAQQAKEQLSNAWSLTANNAAEAGKAVQEILTKNSTAQ